MYAAFKSGAHLNPAVTMGIWTSGAEEFAPGIPVTAANGFLYVTAQMAGAAIGAVLAFLAYKKHFDEDADPAHQARRLLHRPGHPLLRRGTSSPRSSAPSSWSSSSSLRQDARASSARSPSRSSWSASAPASVAPPGYAINPARDLGPRIAHALLPIRGKGSSDWAYSWVPVLGPLVGGVLAGLVAAAYIV